MAKYQRYAEYQDSGVEWLGEIPSHWRTVYLKMVVDVRDGTHDTPSYVDPDSNTFPLVTSKDVTSGKIDLTECKHISALDYEIIIKRSCVSQGDILMPMIGTVGSPVLVESDNEIAIKNLALFRTSILSQQVYNKFLYYFLNATECNIQFTLEGRGGVQNFVSLGTLRNLYLPLVLIQEQVPIANFLDHETAKIDSLIEKQKKLIELLKEKRQAVISHAVTKGLNPNVPMKDSGVEWLGEVPQHWGVSALGYYAFLNTGATPDRSNMTFWNGKIPWVKTGEVNYNNIYEAEEYISNKAIKSTSVQFSPAGTLLMAMYGQGKTRGRVAILGVAATYNQACVAISVNKKIFNEYLKLFFTAGYNALRVGGNETSQMNLNADIVKKFKILVPTLIEQREIVNFVNNSSHALDLLLNKAEQAIQLMQERRTALISAAVTGKIDVRHWQAPNQSELEQSA